MKIYLIIILLIGSLVASEKSVTISGYVLDASSGESLIGANIYPEGLKIGTTTNSYGFYSLSVPVEQNIRVIFSYVGYKPQVKKIFLKKNFKLNIKLTPQPISTEEIVVTARKADENIEKKQMSVIDVPVRMIKQLPAILGETDVLKVIQLLPGVQSGSEGTTGFYVRGGNADQNLVLLDEAVVYNPNHLFGLLSTFNSRAINNVTMIKGGFPSQFSGRLSSIGLNLGIRFPAFKIKHDSYYGIEPRATLIYFFSPLVSVKDPSSPMHFYLPLIHRSVLQNETTNENLEACAAKEIGPVLYFDTNEDGAKFSGDREVAFNLQSGLSEAFIFNP